MIDLRARHLVAFLAVADELHFGRAADRLGVAQSAVSQQIRRLEDALGAELLTRTSRRVALTAAGEALRRDAPGLLAQAESVGRRVRAVAAGEAGTVVLGAQGAALIRLVPAAIARLARELPALHVDVRQLTSEEQIRALLIGGLDLGLVRSVAPRDGLVLEEVRREPIMAVLPEAHRLAAGPAVDLRELAGEPFVLWGRAGAPQFFDALVAACEAAGFTPRIRYAVRGIDARLSYIAAGLGVGLEAAGYATLRPAGVTFRPLIGAPVEAGVQLARAAQPPLPAPGRVAEVIREVAAER